MIDYFIQAFDFAYGLSRGHRSTLCHRSTLFSNRNISWGNQSAGENKLFIKEPKLYFNCHWKKFNFFGKSFDCTSKPNVNDLGLLFTIFEPLWILRISRTYCQRRSEIVSWSARGRSEHTNKFHDSFTPFSFERKTRFKFYSFWFLINF